MAASEWRKMLDTRAIKLSMCLCAIEDYRGLGLIGYCLLESVGSGKVKDMANTHTKASRTA